MNIVTFITAVFALLGGFIAVAIFLARQATRMRRLKSLFGRVCIQLSNEQLAELSLHSNIQSMLMVDAKVLTATEFIDDSYDPKRSLLDAIGEVSSSLFHYPSVRTVGFGNILAGFVCLILLLAMSLISPIWDLVAAFARQGDINLVILLGSTLAFGLAFSIICSAIAWYIFFERDLSATLNMVEQRPLWNVGSNRRPDKRSFVQPKDDPVYSALKS